MEQELPKTVLSGSQIKQAIDKGELHIRPLLTQTQITEVGVDFRLGYDFLASIQGREAMFDTHAEIIGAPNFYQTTRRQLGETFILHPQQTVLSATLEYVKLPADTLLMLFMRSSYARLGLSISSIVQPGFCGCASIELTNLNHTAINLTVGARIIQGVFMRVTGDTNYFSQKRKYLCNVRPEPSAVATDSDLEILRKISAR